jgi:flagellar FliL protein
MLPWLISLLLAITLIVVAAVMFWSSLFGDSGSGANGEDRTPAQAEPMSADELLEVTSELTDIRTNIADADYVVVLDLSFQLDSKEAKESFDKIKDVAIRPIVNKALWQMTREELAGTAGKDKLSADLINAINPVLPTGKLTKVEITSFIMTPI